MFLAKIQGVFLGLSSLGIAIQPDQGMTGEEAAGCAACGAMTGGVILIPIGIIALNIYLLIWVAKDAKARAMDNAVMWVILVAVLGVLGLGIYLASRPTGTLVTCSSCSNKRMETSATCPQCGNS